jgi:hypothetical protein
MSNRIREELVAHFAKRIWYTINVPGYLTFSRLS